MKEIFKISKKTFGKPDSDTERRLRRHTAVTSRSTLTFDLQPAVHLGLSQVVDGLAGVQAAIIRARFPDLKSAYTLIAKHAVAWVIEDGDLILHPDHLSLRDEIEL